MMQQFPIFFDLHVVPPLIIATGHVIADEIDYLRRCGFTHAAIKPAHHLHRQQAHQAIRHHFQHMPDSPQSRRE